MDKRLVITIGRQCGSGGRRIGQMLAEQLGIKCYDKEILNRLQKRADLPQSCLKLMMRSLPVHFCTLL